MPRKGLTRAVLALEPITDEDRQALAERPRTRSECPTEGPCPWVSCKHHLYLDIGTETGSIKVNFPELEPHELRNSCALDVAERGGITLEEVGQVMNLTRERIRQIEIRGLLKLKARVKP